MRILFILGVWTVYVTSLCNCVKTEGCKIKKVGFISPILNISKKIALKNKKVYTNGSYEGEYGNLEGNTTLLETVGNQGYKISQKDTKNIFDVDDKGKNSLKLPIKSTLNSLIPEILEIFKFRKKLSLGPLISILSCSGGVDSMSLLHSLGIIKNNYNFLLENDYIKIKSPGKDSNDTETDKESNVNKLDKKKLIENEKEEIKRMLKEFFENFNVVYFNHKQRDDVDEDIKVIEEGCKEYEFNFMVEEIPNLLLEENKKKGSQNTFRKWRRDMCTKIIDESSLNSTERNNGTNKENKKDSTNELILKEELKVNNKIMDEINKLKHLKGLVFMAHNLDDNFETVVLKIVRGSYLSNLTPMELYDNLDSENYILVRPFIDVNKSKLMRFMEEINKEYNEDSSNSKLCYTRNIVRNLVIPQTIQKFKQKDKVISNEQLINKNNVEDVESSDIFMGLDLKLKNLSEQCNKFNDLIQNEVDTFLKYINSKYNISSNNNNNNISSNIANISSNKEQIDRIYGNFYESLLWERYGEVKDKSELSIKTNFNYFKRIGIKLENYFYLKEWTIIPNKLIKEQVLNKFIFEYLGKNIPYKTLNKLFNELNKTPYSSKLKLWSLGNLLLHHQGYLLKFYPQEFVRKRKTSDHSEDNKELRELLYSDDNVNVYNSIKNLKISISKSTNQRINNSLSKFYLNFNINPCNNNNIDKNKILKKEKVEIEIRYLKEEDVAPSKKMWNNSVFRILGQAGINMILKYEIPAIVEMGTNKVIGLYGVNLSPPYFNKDHQEIYYQSNRMREPLQLRITLN